MFLSNKKIKRLFDYWKEKKPNYFDYNTIGKTNLHQNIYFCTITNKQEVGEKESILFIGSIHGDEISGVYLCREFIHHLMIQNNQDNYLEGKIIYILPTLNPDGYGNHVGKKWIPKRENANGIDLNRNFYHDEVNAAIYCDNETNQVYEVETLSMMEWSKKTKFTLVITYHTGDVGINVPFDYPKAKYSSDGQANPTNKHDLFLEIANFYVENNKYMAETSSFPSGVINGAEWYVAEHTMPDWRFLATNVPELTIELSFKMHPTREELEKIWLDNKDAMINVTKKITTFANKWKK